MKFKAKEDHFIALLSQQNEECISASMSTQSLNASTTNKGGRYQEQIFHRLKLNLLLDHHSHLKKLMKMKTTKHFESTHPKRCFNKMS